MNRRDFLKITSAAGLALSIPGPLADWLAPPPFFKLSLAQWSLHRAILEQKTLDPLDFPRQARELGFEGVEYVSQLYTRGINRIGMSKMMKTLQQRSRDHGIQNVLIMVDNEGELASVDPAEREDAIAHHLHWVEAAQFLGCHSIRVNLFGRGAEHDATLWKQTAADGLGRLAEKAAPYGINIIVENHGGLSSHSARLMEVLRAINLPNCGTLPDFGNFCVRRDTGERWAGQCIETYDKYQGVAEMMPLAKGVSAKSYDFDAAGNETSIDYVRMLKIVKESGYTGFIGVEYEGSRLSETDGILATKALLLKAAGQIQ